MIDECKKCQSAGCCFNCINYIDSYQFEYMININCQEHDDVQTQERGYPIIDGKIETNCCHWTRRTANAHTQAQQ